MEKITLGIDGMMCGMCENHINDTVRRNFNVEKVSSSCSKNETVIISKEHIDETRLRSVIDSTGYTVTGYKSEPYVKKSGKMSKLFG